MTDIYYLTQKALCSFQAPPGVASRKIPVAHSEWETPLPIPNRAVKPLCADGTWGATSWESRSPPVLSYCGPRQGLARAAAPDRRRITPSAVGLRSAATRRRRPRTYCLPLGPLASAPIPGADRGTTLIPLGGCSARCESWLSLRWLLGGLVQTEGLRNPGECSQRALARTRQGLRSRLGGRRRRSAGG